MRKMTHKLSLNRDTLRQLDATTLADIAAAAINNTGGSFTTCCPSICVCPETKGPTVLQGAPDA